MNRPPANPLRRYLAALLCALLLAPLARAAAEDLAFADARAKALACRSEVQTAQTDLALLRIQRDKLRADLEALLEKQPEQSLRQLLSAARKAAQKNARKKRKQAPAAPPQITLRQDIAARSDEIADAENRLYGARLAVAAGCETAYCEALLAETRAASQAQNAAEALHALRLAREQLQLGALPVAALAPLEERLLQTRAAGEKAVLDAQSKRRALATWIGEEIGPAVSLAPLDASAAPPEAAPEEAAAFALARDPVVRSADRNVLQAQSDLLAVLGDDPNLYRHYLKEIGDYRIARREDAPDYAVFWKHYHQPALEAPGMWDGDYSLPWAVFRATMPRAWLRPQTLPEAVAADRPAALFALQVGKDEATRAAEAARTARRDIVAAMYGALRAVEKERQIAEKSLALAEADCRAGETQEKLGRGDFSALRQSEFQRADCRAALAELRVRLHLARVAYNLASFGYLDAPPSAAPAPETTDEATWFLETSAADPQFRFGVHLPPALEIEAFCLFYGEEAFGPPTPSAETLRAPRLPYAASETLRLELYRRQALAYTATIPASCCEGVLKLAPAEAVPLSDYERLRQKKAALQTEANALQTTYLDAVQQGDTDLQKQRKTALNRAVAALRDIDRKLAALEKRYAAQGG